MNPYHSIETVWKRDPKTHQLELGVHRMDWTRIIKSWSVTEKIDGTNIRAILTPEGWDIRGRTDKAILQPGAKEAVLSALPSVESVAEYFRPMIPSKPEWPTVTIYGECYGPGIQKGGCYSTKKEFSAFDILIGESGMWWLAPHEFNIAAYDLGIQRVPELLDVQHVPATFSDLLEIIPFSFEAQCNGMERCMAEGIVAKPREVLFDRHGNRVMWKLTFRDLPK